MGLDEEPYSFSDVEGDPSSEVGVPPKSRDISTDKDSQLLKLVTTLMDRLEIFEGNSTNTAIHRSRGQSKAANTSALRRSRHHDTPHNDAISSTARKHAAATRRGKRRGRRIREGRD